jgi:prolipoprotein diacylglyceryltransferase
MVLGRFWNLGSGLASHGGALGCLVALIAFWWRRGKPLGIGFHRYGDALMLSSVWVYPFVRLGNFMNSEIVGRPTDVPWGVIFERHYSTPATPRAALRGGALLRGDRRGGLAGEAPRGKLREGSIMYGMLALHFSFRFVCEFFKESQAIDQGWSLNMGHLLSAPIVIGCAYLVLATQRFSLIAPLSEEELKENARVFRAPEELALAAAEPAAEPSSEDAGSPAPSSTGPATKKKKKKKA